MNLLITIGLLILALSILVTIHELGHFWAAKWFGMRVETFSLFFPPKIWGIKRGDTTYQIGCIPLGGYVKIAGMIDESMDKEHLNKAPEPWEFRSKPAWQRLIVMLGGIIMNLILGCLIFIVLKFMFGDTVIPMEKLEDGVWVLPGTAGDSLGFKNGDMITSFKGEPVKYFNDINNPAILLEDDAWFGINRGGEEVRLDVPFAFLNRFQDMPAEKQILFTINGINELKLDSADCDRSVACKAGLKDGDIITMVDSVPVNTRADLRSYMDTREPLTEALVTFERDGIPQNLAVVTDSMGFLGLSFNNEKYFDKIEYSFVQSIGVGTVYAFKFLLTNIKGFKALFTGKANLGKSVSGPIKIGAQLGAAFRSGGWVNFWSMVGLLSMVLAFMNLLPIPALDGGHVMFLLYEIITGREPNDKVKIISQQVGMVLLLLLIGFILLNDILNL
ncbi:MAG: RIP metalloprotease RseP [Bacteroidia bacterium]|nr:RIP metalloprotease RseP [Bacteroidia bacterium]